MMQSPTFPSTVYWLPSYSGGRAQPPTGPVYSATTRFAEDPLDKQFSIVLRFVPSGATNGANAQDADLQLLFPDQFSDVDTEFRSGRQLLIHEGKRVVGVCAIGCRANLSATAAQTTSPPPGLSR
jgi:hypothetical protein